MRCLGEGDSELRTGGDRTAIAKRLSLVMVVYLVVYLVTMEARAAWVRGLWVLEVDV
jgi:hypothetical protein